MTKQSIGLGTVANDGTGDDLRTAGDKINDNFDELYNLLGDGADLAALGTMAAEDAGDYSTTTEVGTAISNAISALGLGTMAAEDAADYTPTSGLGTAAFADTGDFMAAGAVTQYTDTYAKAAAVDDTPYDATSWNGVTDKAPSKNVVRDLYETLLGGVSSALDTLGEIATALAARVLSTDLASTANAKGASLVGIEDAGGLLTATTVEAALAELAAGGGGSVSDTAYASSWNGDTTDAPSKNAVYDKFEGFLHPGWIASRWYCLLEVGPVLSAGALINNTLSFYPVILNRRVTISDLSAVVITTDSGKAFALGIYANDASTGRPTGNPLAATGDMSTTTGTTVTADITGANVTLDPGIYWIATWANTNVGALRVINNTMINQGGRIIGSATAGNVMGGCLTLTTTSNFNSASWPDVTGASWNEASNGARLFVISAKAA